MNLYKIIFSHTAPKDTIIGIKTYLLAKNDDEVYDYINAKCNSGWEYQEKDCEVFDVYDDDCNRIGTETFCEKMMRIKGEINDEDFNFCDAYYGITLYGWELIKVDIKGNFKELIKLGILNCIEDD